VTMRNQAAPALAVAILASGLCAAAAAAAIKPFPPPSGWDHVQQQAPPGTIMLVWTKDSGPLQQTLTVVDDPNEAYADAVQRVQKNITANKFKVSANHDQLCNGVTGHLFAMAYGPDVGRVAVDRLILPDGTGSEQITYMRPEPEPFAGEIKSELNTYCGTTVE
jgi:hypothetical protein